MLRTTVRSERKRKELHRQLGGENEGGFGLLDIQVGLKQKNDPEL